MLKPAGDHHEYAYFSHHQSCLRGCGCFCYSPYKRWQPAKLAHSYRACLALPFACSIRPFQQRQGLTSLHCSCEVTRTNLNSTTSPSKVPPRDFTGRRLLPSLSRLKAHCTAAMTSGYLLRIVPKMVESL